MRSYAKREVTKAEACIQQLCCSGLDSESVIPAVLNTLHDYVPSYANAYIWCNRNAEIVNLYDERPEATDLLPLYFNEFYDRTERDVFTSWRQHIRLSNEAADFDTLLTVPRRHFLRHEFYGDFLRQLDFYWGAHLVVREAGQPAGVLVLHRTKKDKPFSAAEIRLLNRLGGFLAHAVRCSDRQRHPWVGTEDQGIIITSDSGRIEWLSKRARQLLFLQRYPQANAETLSRTEAASLPDQVRRLCGRLAQHSSGGLLEQPPVWYDSNRWGQFCFRLGRLDPSIDGDGKISITLELQQPLPVRLISKVSKLPLTAREMQIGVLMALGTSNVNIADKLNMSEHTAISHSRAVYQKLGVQNRNEVLSRLLSS